MLEELSEHLETLTTAGGKELNQEVLKNVKNICKISEENVAYAFHVIMVQLNKKHSEIRYSALLVINELFKRSHVFRELLLSDFQHFLELTAETKQEYFLPPPKAAAQSLKIKTLELVQQWNDRFGEDYKRLKLGYNFLRDCKKVDFANLHARSIVEQRRQLDRQRQQAKIIQDKVNKVSSEMSEKIPEINDILNQMENCFRLLLPSFDLFSEDIDLNMPSTSKYVTSQKAPVSALKQDKTEMLAADVDNKETAERKNTLRHHGLHGFDNFTIEVAINPHVETNSNTVDIVNNLKDLYTQVEKCMLPSVERWIQILTKGSNCTALLKKAISFKNSLLSAKEKFKELKFLPQLTEAKENSDDDDDDDDFEIVKEKEGYEDVVPSHLKAECDFKPSTATGVTMTKASEKNSPEEIKDPTSYECNVRSYYKKLIESSPDDAVQPLQCSSESSALDPKKAEVLSKAPHMPYDIDLYHWEDEKIEAPSIIRFDSQHKFWKPYENETTETQDKEAVAALRMRKIDFSGKFVPVKWRCRAPLPNGKLCPRQDRYKCPFHGTIIPRDEAGNPKEVKDVVANESTQDDVPEWQDPEFLRDLEASTGVNLQMPKKRGKKGSSNRSKKRKYPNLTDIGKEQNTTRKRLERKLFKKQSLEKVADEMNEIDRKKHDDKFGNQWVYAFNF